MLSPKRWRVPIGAFATGTVTVLTATSFRRRPPAFPRRSGDKRPCPAWLSKPIRVTTRLISKSRFCSESTRTKMSTRLGGRG